MAAKIPLKWEKSPYESDGRQNRKRERKSFAALIFFQHKPQHAPTLKLKKDEPETEPENTRPGFRTRDRGPISSLMG
jgi:hypothetical protein